MSRMSLQYLNYIDELNPVVAVCNNCGRSYTLIDWRILDQYEQATLDSGNFLQRKLCECRSGLEIEVNRQFEYVLHEGGSR